jgi:type IV pilus assembly protein PilM
MNISKTIKNALTIKFDKAFGLDIGDRSLEIIEMDKMFRFSVVTYGRTELPEGVVENGRIIDTNILGERLKKMLKEAKPKKVSTNKVIVSLPESQVYVRCFSVPAGLKSVALTKAITDNVSLSLPINIDKTYWDFAEKSLPDKANKLIIFVSLAKDVANSYVKFCNSIGLEVVSLCVESLSLARVILRSSPRQSLIMDIGAGATNLSFFDSNDKINMSVTVPVAGGQMTQAIKDKMKVDTDEAESLKAKFGFKDGADNRIRPIILPLLEEIIKETGDAIRYYEETFKQKLEDVYLTGGTALAPGLLPLIKAGLGREVKIAESAYGIGMNSLVGKENSFPIFANVIGLGMLGASGEFRDINLLKKMPSSEANSVNKLNLFSMGYLSKVNAFRTVIDNRFMLVIMIIIIGLIFAILFQQSQQFGVAAVAVPAINNFVQW